MLYLAMAVLVMVANSTLLKLGEIGHQNRFVVMWVNYVVATVITGAVWALDSPQALALPTWIIGPTTGVVFAVGLFVNMGMIQKAGIAVASACSRMSVLWPLGLSLLVFGELPSVPQSLGIVLALTAVLLLLVANRPRGLALRDTAALWLAVGFVVAGLSGMLQKTFTELSPPGDRPAMVALLFATAAITSAVPLLHQRPRILRSDLWRGLAFGTGNSMGASLFMAGLAKVPGVIAFPFTHISVILLASLTGIVFFKERPGPLGFTALGLALCAVALMNL